MSKQLRPALSVSTLVAGVGLAVTLFAIVLGKELGLIEGGFAKRVFGIAMGGVLIVTANVLPKIVRPIAVGQASSRSAMRFERFAGWTFVLTGIVYIGVWLFVPLAHVMLISSVAGLLAFALVGATGLWLRFRSPESGASRLEENALEIRRRASMARGVIVMILHAILWVFAMFLADSIWGDRVAQWMAVGFVIVNGILLTFISNIPWIGPDGDVEKCEAGTSGANHIAEG